MNTNNKTMNNITLKSTCILTRTRFTFTENIYFSLNKKQNEIFLFDEKCKKIIAVERRINLLCYNNIL